MFAANDWKPFQSCYIRCHTCIAEVSTQKKKKVDSFNRAGVGKLFENHFFKQLIKP
jgi:hypothetical protein